VTHAAVNRPLQVSNTVDGIVIPATDWPRQWLAGRRIVWPACCASTYYARVCRTRRAVVHEKIRMNDAIAATPRSQLNAPLLAAMQAMGSAKTAFRRGRQGSSATKTRP
jgi:hypothetical protein